MICCAKNKHRMWLGKLFSIHRLNEIGFIGKVTPYLLCVEIIVSASDCRAYFPYGSLSLAVPIPKIIPEKAMDRSKIAQDVL